MYDSNLRNYKFTSNIIQHSLQIITHKGSIPEVL